MSIPFSLFFFLILQASLLHSSTTTLDTFKIDLDLDPEERWKDVILSKKEYIQQYTKLVLQQLQNTQISALLSEIESSSYFQDTDFSKEMMGVAKYSDLSYSEVFINNFMYETFAGCTSIVYENADGEVVLGHNLDYFFTVPIGHLIVLLEFYRNGNLLYKAQSVAGQIGVFTALQPNGYALTLNQRTKGDSGDLMDHLRDLFNNEVYPVIYNMRLGLDKTKNFEDAVTFFSNVQLGANCYFILSGIEHNQGIVITRNPNGVDDSIRLNSDENDEWFLVQTNSDRDLPNYSQIDIRRAQAENRVKAIGKDEISSDKLMNDVLNLSPNKNSITFLSGYLSAQTGEFETTMWI